MNPELARSAAAFIELVKSQDNILLSSHVGPDGDSLGSQIAIYIYLKSMGKRVWIYNEGHIPHSFNSFDEISLVQTEPEKWLVPPEGFGLAIIFECTSLDRIGNVKNILNGSVPLVNIDHHRENERFGKLNLVDINASSVGEMIYRIFKQAGFRITIEVAEYLYLAILTDTGRFHFTSTTPDSFRVAAELLEIGLNVKALTDRIYYNGSEAQIRLTGEVISKMELFFRGQACILTLTREDLQRHDLKYGDMEGLVEWTTRIKGVKVGVLLKDMEDDLTKISFRSQGDVDVCKLAQKFSGGGHLNASGGHYEADLATTKQELLKEIEALLANGK